jgi:hypothetical protein
MDPACVALYSGRCDARIIFFPLSADIVRKISGKKRRVCWLVITGLAQECEMSDRY